MIDWIALLLGHDQESIQHAQPGVPGGRRRRRTAPDRHWPAAPVGRRRGVVDPDGRWRGDGLDALDDARTIREDLQADTIAEGSQISRRPALLELAAQLADDCAPAGLHGEEARLGLDDQAFERSDGSSGVCTESGPTAEFGGLATELRRRVGGLTEIGSIPGPRLPGAVVVGLDQRPEDGRGDVRALAGVLHDDGDGDIRQVGVLLRPGCTR